MNVVMSSIQAYKVHKQEETIAARCTKGTQHITVHLPKHPYISGCMIIAALHMLIDSRLQ